METALSESQAEAEEKKTNRLVSSLHSKRFRGEKSEKPGFQRFARAKNGARAKIGRSGVGEGSEGNACGQTP